MKKFLIVLLAVIGLALSISESASAQGKILVAYFSRTGEEYGVGNISRGNTAIIAGIIAQKTGGDLFEIKTVKSYPTNYQACTEVASREKADKARPALSNAVNNFAQYDTIFLGYPIWWGDCPMAIYTFLESYDFSGKTIIPFCTHAGSGLSGTERRIATVCPNAKVLNGFEIRGATAQNKFSQAESAVNVWLKAIQ